MNWLQYVDPRHARNCANACANTLLDMASKCGKFSTSFAQKVASDLEYWNKLYIV